MRWGASSRGRSSRITFPAVLLPPNIILSYRWAGHEGSLGLKGLLGLNRAKNFLNFKKSLRNWESGPLNFVYADTFGNIGYFAHGKFPIRPDPGRVGAPYIPVSGNGTYEWEGFRKNVPELYNPPSVNIITANNDPFGKNAFERLAEYDDYFGYQFAPGARAKRIRQMLNKHKGDIDFERNQKMQFGS